MFEMTYTPRSVPLPEPKRTDSLPAIVAENDSYKILNLLSIIANCMEEYDNPARGLRDDPAYVGNLSEFHGCLVSAISHWLFMFEAASMLAENKPIMAEKKCEYGAGYNKEELAKSCRPLMKWINDNCHPHHVVIVDHTNVQLFEGQISFNTNDYVRD